MNQDLFNLFSKYFEDPNSFSSERKDQRCTLVNKDDSLTLTKRTIYYKYDETIDNAHFAAFVKFRTIKVIKSSSEITGRDTRKFTFAPNDYFLYLGQTDDKKHRYIMHKPGAGKCKNHNCKCTDKRTDIPLDCFINDSYAVQGPFDVLSFGFVRRVRQPAGLKIKLPPDTIVLELDIDGHNTFVEQKLIVGFGEKDTFRNASNCQLPENLTSLSTSNLCIKLLENLDNEFKFSEIVPQKGCVTIRFSQKSRIKRIKKDKPKQEKRKRRRSPSSYNMRNASFFSSSSEEEEEKKEQMLKKRYKVGRREKSERKIKKVKIESDSSDEEKPARKRKILLKSSESKLRLLSEVAFSVSAEKNESEDDNDQSPNILLESSSTVPDLASNEPLSQSSSSSTIPELPTSDSQSTVAATTALFSKSKSSSDYLTQSQSHFSLHSQLLSPTPQIILNQNSFIPISPRIISVPSQQTLLQSQSSFVLVGGVPLIPIVGSHSLSQPNQFEYYRSESFVSHGSCSSLLNLANIAGTIK